MIVQNQNKTLGINYNSSPDEKIKQLADALDQVYKRISKDESAIAALAKTIDKNQTNHGHLPYGINIHSFVSYVYANSTVRSSDSGFLSTDVFKVAYQTSDSTFWVLTDYNPVTWVAL